MQPSWFARAVNLGDEGRLVTIPERDNTPHHRYNQLCHFGVLHTSYHNEERDAGSHDRVTFVRVPQLTLVVRECNPSVVTDGGIPV